jgi:hypothetical protein
MFDTKSITKILSFVTLVNHNLLWLSLFPHVHPNNELRLFAVLERWCRCLHNWYRWWWWRRLRLYHRLALYGYRYLSDLLNWLFLDDSLWLLVRIIITLNRFKAILKPF